MVRKCLNKSTKKEVGIPRYFSTCIQKLIKVCWFFKCFNSFLPLTKVAIKFVSKKMQKKEQVAQEADVLLHVQNHQLVALLDTYESPTSLMLVLEL